MNYKIYITDKRIQRKCKRKKCLTYVSYVYLVLTLVLMK